MEEEMRKDRLKTAIDECNRFVAAARKVQAGPLRTAERSGSDPNTSVSACKRSSMDLTRALADLRRDDYGAGPT